MKKFCPTCQSNTHFKILFGEFWSCEICGKPLRDRNQGLRGYKMAKKVKAEGNSFEGEVEIG